MMLLWSTLAWFLYNTVHSSSSLLVFAVLQLAVTHNWKVVQWTRSQNRNIYSPYFVFIMLRVNVCWLKALLLVVVRMDKHHDMLLNTHMNLGGCKSTHMEMCDFIVGSSQGPINECRSNPETTHRSWGHCDDVFPLTWKLPPLNKSWQSVLTTHRFSFYLSSCPYSQYALEKLQ